MSILWQGEEFQAGATWVLPSHPAPTERGLRKAPGYQRSINAHANILRLQGLNPLSDVAIIDVAAVNFHEIAQSEGLVSRGFIGRSQFVMQRGASLLIDLRKLERLF